jgi:hypothetical protein
LSASALCGPNVPQPHDQIVAIPVSAAISRAASACSFT